MVNENDIVHYPSETNRSILDEFVSQAYNSERLTASAILQRILEFFFNNIDEARKKTKTISDRGNN